MTARANLDVAAARLRQAVAEGAYARAGQVLLEHRQQLERSLAGLPAGGREADELEREAQALLEWARRAVLASRATAAGRLKRVPKPLAAYRATPARARHTFEFTA